MNYIKRLAIVFFLLCSTLVKGNEPPAEPLSAEQTLGFAHHLYQEQDYYRAITEYERFNFLFPSHTLRPAVQYRIALCYLAGGKIDAARERFISLKDTRSGTHEARKAELTLAGSYYAEGAFARAGDDLDNYLASHQDVPETDSVRLQAGLCRLRAEQRDLAMDYFRKTSPTSAVHGTAQKLLDQADAYDRIPSKSPKLAGALSAVLPGAGQLYVDRPHDALIAFALNGLLIWGAYASFENDETATGVLLTAIEAGWYFGNIYNASSNAHKYNRRSKEDFFRNLELRYSPAFLPSGEWGAVGGASFTF